jgi:hypothetical protein
MKKRKITYPDGPVKGKPVVTKTSRGIGKVVRDIARGAARQAGGIGAIVKELAKKNKLNK